ncbi:MAG: IclR family transcriptional regulator [Dermatophilaceae bacterium]
MAASTSASPIEAIDRALLLLNELAAAGAKGVSLAELAHALGINKSTAYRALFTLRSRDFVQQDAGSGHYLLGTAAIALGTRYLDGDSLVVLLHPALVALSREVDELVHLGVLAADRVLYVDKVEPDRAIRVWSQVGRTVPVASTSLGRALLAYRGTERDQLSAYMNALPADRPQKEDHVWERIQQARRVGYATEFMENEPGIACVGVPILRGSSAVAALSITAPADRMDPTRMHALAAAVQAVVPALLPLGLAIPDETGR